MKHLAYKVFLAAKLVVVSFFSANVVAQSEFNGGERVEIEGAKSYVLSAESLDEQYLIHVVEAGTQRIQRGEDQRLPIVYVLDGNTQFQLASSLASILAGSRLAGFGNGIPQVLIVSIGYVPNLDLDPLENYNRMILQQRHRDYTPVLDDEFVAADPDLPPHSGAPLFLQFIEQELKPFIADHYSVNSDDETLIGHSMGGLFVLWTLMNSPQSFDRYVAASPGLAWGSYRPLGQEIQFRGPEQYGYYSVYRYRCTLPGQVGSGFIKTSISVHL
ncbi:MAG: alpha/beta hydrolase-fold protein [Pseudohongiellaceae bacterium]